MNKPFKVTYKAHKFKGLSRVGAGHYVEVKHKRKQFAIISGASAFHPTISIQYAVKKDSAWTWKFIRLGTRDLDVAKKYLMEKLPEILANNELHFFED